MENTGPININLDLSGVKTAIPLIADNTWTQLRLNKVELVPVPDKGNALVFTYQTVDPVMSTDGTTIAPGALGSRLVERIQLYAKPDAKNPTWFLDKLAKRVDALLGTGDKGNTKGKPERPNTPFNELIPALIGQTIYAQIKVRNDANYTGNEINTAMHPSEVAQAA